MHKYEFVNERIDGVKIWVGEGMTGGTYNEAEKIGTISYESGTNPYVFSDLAVRGSSIQIQGSTSYLSLAEVEVYERDGKHMLSSSTINSIRRLWAGIPLQAGSMTEPD